MLTDWDPGCQKFGLAGSEKDAIVMDSGGKPIGNIMSISILSQHEVHQISATKYEPQHRPLDKYILLPSHEVSDE